VWVNFKEVFHSNAATLNSMVNLPVGTNERLVIQALDAKGGRRWFTRSMCSEKQREDNESPNKK